MVDSKLILITLLVKLGVAAAISSALARSRSFQNLLFKENRTSTQTLGLLAWICIPLTLGVLVRITVQNFLAADIAFETVIILGVLLGPLAAVTGGMLLSLPAMLHHEYLTLPFNLAVALIAGIYGRLVTAEEVWSFSPFVDLSIYRWVRRNLRKPRFDRQILLLTLIVGMEIGREWLAAAYPRRLFALVPATWPVRLAVYACSAMVVGIPLKIWNAIRIERKLEEQKRLLLEARFDALQRQINPHFLFNTLNSIASLVRFRPEMAREMIVRLANILRALLKDHDTFVALREELNFTEDYLGIEVVRFGADKLRVVKEIDPATLEMMVPSMLLQPLIENSIKHGIEPRISGGTITMRSRLHESSMMIEVEDDGVGMTEKRQPAGSVGRKGSGIGMRNVRERLEVLYGEAARFDVTSRPGRGTRVTLEIPVMLNENGDPVLAVAPGRMIAPGGR
ncbi:Autolysin sensor kinase [Acidisarcina polymorpha]|uniref:histidine kinase n=1 Tax=Acidisarcina polymorpha TaxID=2211140 RepID=A0A2Z5FVN9_9BACT|nr:histidine kinase [Acidisarcina polymorpha]AXC10564.1 Autolysin sensor kinase [Acidisarcina polymorpha]